MSITSSLSRPLAFPRISATVTGQAVRLEVEGSADRTFEAASVEEALAKAYAHAAGIARVLGRGVYVHVSDKSHKKTLVVYPDGEVSTEKVVSLEDQKSPLWRRKMVLIPVAVLLVLGGAGAWGIAAMGEPESGSVQPPASVSFSTDNGAAQGASLSGDGQYLTYLDGRTVYVVSASSGELVSKTDLKHKPAENTFMVRPHESGGFVYLGEDQAIVWSAEKKAFSSPKALYANNAQVITRASTTVTAAKEHKETPTSVTTIDGDKYRSPTEGASFIAWKGDTTYWAVNRDGGAVISADKDGNEKETHKLVPPVEGAAFSTWVGMSVQGEIITSWDVGDQTVIAFQRTGSDELAAGVTVPKSNGAEVDYTGQVLLAGESVINCSDHTSYMLERAPDGPKTQSVGFESLGAWIGPRTTEFIDGDPQLVVGRNAAGEQVKLSGDRKTITIVKEN